MKRAPAATIYLYDGPLRTASGALALWQDGRYFAPHQGEWYVIDDRDYASIDWQIGVLQLNNGAWLSHPEGFAVYDRQFASREAALRNGVSRILRTARVRLRAPYQYQSRIDEEQYRAVIAWAYRLLGAPEPQIYIAPPPTPAKTSLLDFMEASP
jgi:hypothetical protein